MPGCNTEPLGISSRSYLPPLLKVYGMKTRTHVHTCTCVQHSEHMWRPEVNVRCLLYSPPPPLLSFKEKALRWSASTAGTGRRCSRSLRGGRVRRTEQWDPAVSSCRYGQPKASHTLGESILFPAQGCLEDISSV